MVDLDEIHLSFVPEPRPQSESALLIDARGDCFDMSLVFYLKTPRRVQHERCLWIQN